MERPAVLIGRAVKQTLRGLFTVSRALERVDRAFVTGPGRSLLVIGRAFAQGLARAHQGSAQDMALLYLAGLALLLIGRLFGT
ncbi:MAG: hypothetical protein ACREOU_12370 [Candidatus Eiseniibacteriota bacterium]